MKKFSAKKQIKIIVDSPSKLQKKAKKRKASNDNSSNQVEPESPMEDEHKKKNKKKKKAKKASDISPIFNPNASNFHDHWNFQKFRIMMYNYINKYTYNLIIIIF